MSGNDESMSAKEHQETTLVGEVKGQKTEDKGWWLLNAAHHPAQSSVLWLPSSVHNVAFPYSQDLKIKILETN